MSGDAPINIYKSTLPTLANNQQHQGLVDSRGRMLTSDGGAAPIGGDITWGAATGVAMTGSSKTFVPANAARKAIIMWNPSANASGAIDLAGGTVVLATGIALNAGAAPTSLVGAVCPVGIITAIGTNLQSFYYQEGT